MKLLGKIVPSHDLTKVEVTLEADCKETQQAKKGDKVTVHYGGFLQDGETKPPSSKCAMFHSSICHLISHGYNKIVCTEYKQRLPHTLWPVGFALVLRGSG